MMPQLQHGCEEMVERVSSTESPQMKVSDKETEEGEKEERRKERQEETKHAPKRTSRRDFEAKYVQLASLGSGGQGWVFAGYRRADHLPVAIKYIPQKDLVRCGRRQNGRKLPLEVAVMMKICQPDSEGKSAAISLLEYFDLDKDLILILERPNPVIDLLEYINDKDRPLTEEEARVIMRQLVQAALELQAKRIFHRDIKMENILIETSTEVPRLRLIDFGHSCFTKEDSVYRTFSGTQSHAPPEWFRRSKYTAGPSTVWQLGVVLYEILQDQFDTELFLEKKLSVTDNLSSVCQDWLHLCLAVDPWQRASLEQLLDHPWLT